MLQRCARQSVSLAQKPLRAPARLASGWAKVPRGPEDPILGVTVAFQKDTSPLKINLGVGAYRDDNGKPFVLSCVKQAEEQLRNLDHEYGPIGGLADFTRLSKQLQLGADHAGLDPKHVVTVQALSGTGALRVGADFMQRHLDNPTKSTIWVPNPTWGNHPTIYKDAGFKTVKQYRYYDDKTCGLDFAGMLEDVKNAPAQSIFLFHACAHNPTGVDPNMDQWKKLSQVCKERKHFVFFDLAYQGFASGDTDKDAAPVRLFIKDGHNVGIAQSFAKNFGLYGERIGALSFVTESAEVAENLESQLKILIRPMYSNPPVHGARLVSKVLGDQKLYALWKQEVKHMADRVIAMRHQLVKNLKAEGSTRDWRHITDQIGMFCYTGLNAQQCKELIEKHHVYLTSNGRISIAGITSHNVGHLARSIHAVSK